MVYCKLKTKTDDSAVYNIGTTIGDMTGEITFFKGLREPVLNKQASKYHVRNVDIAKIYGKYKGDFESGNFAEKIAVES